MHCKCFFWFQFFEITWHHWSWGPFINIIWGWLCFLFHQLIEGRSLWRPRWMRALRTYFIGQCYPQGSGLNLRFEGHFRRYFQHCCRWKWLREGQPGRIFSYHDWLIHQVHLSLRYQWQGHAYYPEYEWTNSRSKALWYRGW